MSFEYIQNLSVLICTIELSHNILLPFGQHSVTETFAWPALVYVNSLYMHSLTRSRRRLSRIQDREPEDLLRQPGTLTRPGVFGRWRQLAKSGPVWQPFYLSSLRAISEYCNLKQFRLLDFENYFILTFTHDIHNSVRSVVDNCNLLDDLFTL